MAASLSDATKPEGPLLLISSQHNEIGHLVESLQNQVIYVSATPADYELKKTEGVYIEQVIRPTGLLDPLIEVRPSLNQIDDLIEEYNTNCADKCLPGYVRCQGEPQDKCILECDCCETFHLTCCDSNNHPDNDYNYAKGEG